MVSGDNDDPSDIATPSALDCPVYAYIYTYIYIYLHSPSVCFLFFRMAASCDNDDPSFITIPSTLDCPLYVYMFTYIYILPLTKIVVLYSLLRVKDKLLVSDTRPLRRIHPSHFRLPCTCIYIPISISLTKFVFSCF